MRFIAFDVETPNSYNNRISAIGVTVVEDGKIVVVTGFQGINKYGDLFQQLQYPADRHHTGGGGGRAHL